MAKPSEIGVFSDILPSDIQSILHTDPFFNSIPVGAAYPISGGVAHRIYCVEAQDDRYYLKIRGDHFVTIPAIKCDPNDIENEYRSLLLFAEAVPDHFPTVLSYDARCHYLVLSDVVQGGKKLEDVLLKNEQPKGLFELYGRTLKKIQQKTRMITQSIRTNGDNEYYNTVLHHRLKYRRHPILDDLAYNLSSLPNRQLIMGDPAPKNIGFRINQQLLTFYDLETAHQGNPEFDYAYGIAHTILHTLPTIEAVRDGLTQFLKGYGDVEYDSKLIFQLSMGIMLYRLHSIIPYPINLSNNEKITMEAHIEQLLFKITGKESWDEMVKKMIVL